MVYVVPRSIRDAALSTELTLLSTFYRALGLEEEGIGGAFVECGVFKGAQVAMMAKALCKELPRPFYLFDSFEGIPMAGPKDTQQPGVGPISGGDGALISSGISSCSLEEVRNNFKRWGIDDSRFAYHKGWFQDTIPVVAKAMPHIALLRLDGDLYESTKVCLEHLYPLVSPGGIIIVDDYALDGARLAVHEYLGGPPPNMQRDDNPPGIDVVWWRKP